jgi:NAD(P)-dependent dehydrogenase (short-subunit alcohol dehydrogenase family)
MQDSEKPMSGKICLVTGATSGIGAATALLLARQGATVIGVGRNPEKCSSGVDEIRRAGGNPSIEFMLADLSVQSEIHELARQFKEKHQRLDVLINNAGARFSSRLLSADGYEMTFALNHLGYFLLTNLLLDELKRSGRARIINVASGAHWGCPGIDFDDLQGEKRFSGKEAYAQSKLANLLFTYELNRQLKGTGVTVNAADPGNVMTRFSRNNGLISWARHIIGSLKGGNLVGPREGAKTSVYLASSPEVDGMSGKCFFNKQIVESSNVSYDADAARRLWEISLDLVNLKTARNRNGNFS